MPTPVPLQLEAISKFFGPVQALKPLSLDVGAGELLALLGPSGCGKTTTLRIIAGFEAPDTGAVRVGGKDITDLPPNKRGLGIQNYSLFPHMTVAENVAYGLTVRGVGAETRAADVKRMLELVRLRGYGDRGIHQLSGGQQQRVALARSLVTNPAILLLDEPLGALDKNLRESMQFELRDLQRRLGITSILVTHDQEEALTMSDRVAVMAEGEVVQIGTPTDVYEHPRSRFVAECLGTANILTGTVAGAAEPQAWTIDLDLDSGPQGSVAAAGAPPVGRRVQMAIRPERLKIEPPGSGVLVAKIRDIVFRGSYFAYELSVGNSRGSAVRLPSGPRGRRCTRRHGRTELGTSECRPSGGRAMKEKEGSGTAIGGITGSRRTQRKPYRLAQPVWALPALILLTVFFLVPLGANFWRSVSLGEARALRPVVLLRQARLGCLLRRGAVRDVQGLDHHHAGVPPRRLSGLLLHGALCRAVEHCSRVLPRRAAADLDHHAHLRLARAAGQARIAQRLADRCGTPARPGHHQ